MSHIAALMLMYINCDEDTFYALGQLLFTSKYNMKAFYMPSFPKLETFQVMLEKVSTIKAISFPISHLYSSSDISFKAQQTPQSSKRAKYRSEDLFCPMVSPMFYRQLAFQPYSPV